MSSMLEQAIVDAAALREAALKNAEQAIIEKYSPQIKEAVESLLTEQDVASAATSEVGLSDLEAPIAASPMSDPNKEVTLTMSDEEQTYEFDLEELKQQMQQEGPPDEADMTTTNELIDDLGPAAEQEPPEQEDVDDDLGGEELALQEIINVLSELEEDDQEILEEELVVDMAGQQKDGTINTNSASLGYQEEMELAKMEATQYKEENEELLKRLEKLDEAFKASQAENTKIIEVVKKLDSSLKETLLSNAKLLYCNKTLSDASLNERQKIKIVEAIAKAKTPEEAKNLHEALRTTVGSNKKDGPKSLSESVQRRSNLSGIISRRKQPEQEYSFADKMKKLAGIS